MKKEVKKLLCKWLDYGMNVFLWGCGLAVLWVFLQVFCMTSFHIPTDSMEPKLLSGDAILVNKWTYGARLFNIFDAAEGQQVDIRRLPGTDKVRRNDILVFNNPCPRKWRKIEMDLMQYYVKRCVALPGDTFCIKKGRYRVPGCETSLGCVDAQDRFRGLVKEQGLTWHSTLLRAYPGDSITGWTTLDFGPFYIPRANDSVTMDILAVKLYRNVIEWEQKKRLLYKAGNAYLGDSLITGYRFKKNYYFMAGDKVENSKDSRYWGLLPEEFIVGRAVRIWKSVDKESGKIRWNRILKKIK